MDGKQLKSIRENLGFSLAKASAQVHIHPRTWSRYEIGEKPIPEGIIELFCIKNKLKYPID